MSESLRILILEDNPADAELIQFELQDAGFIFTPKVVMTGEDFILGLRDFSPDLILSDYDLPKYNGASALSEAKRQRPETPFILVTGAVTEDRAIDILTQGAKDYVLKHRLQQRLVPAVQRALAEAEEHRARKQAEAELREAHRTLEERVKIRTVELEAEVVARKKTEKALRKSEEKLIKTFRSNPACVGLSRFHDGLVIEANDEMLNVLGYTEDEFIGHTVTELGIWNDLADREGMLQTLMAEGRSINQEHRLRTKAGELLLCNHSAELIEIEEELHVLFTFFDSTKLREAEAALLESESHLARVQEIAHLGSWAWDIGADHIYWSDETYRMFGLQPREFMPRNEDFFGFVHPEDRPRVEQAMQEALAHEPYNIEFRIVRKGGEERYVHSEGEITFDKDDNPVKVEGTVQDITARKQAVEALKKQTQQLEDANKELESFSYSVSHDLKAPLRAIDGYSKMLTKKYGDAFNEDASRMIGVIRSNAEMMGVLIDDLLSFSRVLRDSMTVSEIDMDKLAGEVWNDIHQANPDRELEFKITKLLPGFGDRTLIRQSLVNLFSNAVKFTGNRKPGIVEMSSNTEDGAIVYCVKDNGVGFDMAYYHKLFGVFQRLHSHEAYEGSGVGLAIVQRIINRHGGRVWAESEVDKGATFFFTLPRKE